MSIAADDSGIVCIATQHSAADTLDRLDSWSKNAD